LSREKSEEKKKKLQIIYSLFANYFGGGIDLAGPRGPEGEGSELPKPQPRREKKEDESIILWDFNRYAALAFRKYSERGKRKEEFSRTEGE